VILHTVIPEEFVLAGLGQGVGDAVWWLEDGGGGVRGGERGELSGGPMEKVVAGASGPVRLILRRDGAGIWRVSRLLSSDPSDYLNPALGPGQPLPRLL
jgi:hypothetical protein